MKSVHKSQCGNKTATTLLTMKIETNYDITTIRHHCFVNKVSILFKQWRESAKVRIKIQHRW